MALNEYLKAVVNLFDEKERRCEKEKQCLQTLLAKLESRQGVLDAQLSGHQPDNVRKAIERERKVVVAQRHKALRILEELEGNNSGSRYGIPHFAG